MSDNRQHDDQSGSVSRRSALLAAGAMGSVALAGCTGDVQGQSMGEINPIPNRAFVTDGNGNDPPFDDGTILYDPGPISVPLDRVFAENGFSASPQGPITDSQMMIVRPPADYNPDAGYDTSWVPLTWGDVAGVSGSVELGSQSDGGTAVSIDVEGAIPNGLHTVWVVKFAALENPDEFDAFVTPNGNGLVGFQNLGSRFDDPSEADNAFRVNGDGTASFSREHEGGALTGVPGFRPLDEDPVPFVGEAADYEQSASELGTVSSTLRDEDEIHLVAAYHYDNQTWGQYPGPFHLNAFDARFPFN